MTDRKWIIFFGEDWGRHHSTGQYLAKELAKKYRILWVNSLGMRAPKLNIRDILRIFSKLFEFSCSFFRKREKNSHQREYDKNIEVLSPLAIPLLHSPIIRAFNRAFVLRLITKAMSRWEISNPIVITACPAAVDLVDHLGAKIKVYYCADEYAEMPGMNKALVSSLECELLKKVDIVVASAKMVADSKSKQHANVHYLPHGVDYQLFHRAVFDEQITPSDIAGIKTPIIGFVGLIGEHIDMDIIRHLAEAYKDVSIVMVGPVEEGSELAIAPNIIYTGEKKRDELPCYLAHFDVCIIPYKQTRRVEFANPTKLNEYLAAGRSVVTMPHPEIDKGAIGIYVAKDRVSFAENVGRVLQASKDEKEEISNSMATSTWHDRAQSLLSIIDTCPEKH